MLVTLKGYHWAAAGSSSSGGGDAGQALHPDAVIAAWGLAKPSKLPAALSRGSKVMQPATEALEVAYAAEAKLSIVVEQGAGKTCTASAKFCADALLKVWCRRMCICMSPLFSSSDHQATVLFRDRSRPPCDFGRGGATASLPLRICALRWVVPWPQTRAREVTPLHTHALHAYRTN